MSFDCYCDYDAPSVYHSKMVKAARKSCKCDECGHPIRVGDSYWYVFGVWDGYPGAFSTCRHCRSIWQWVRNNIPCACWIHGGALDGMQELVTAAAEYAPEETRGLRFGYRRLLVKIDRAKRAEKAG